MTGMELIKKEKFTTFYLTFSVKGAPDINTQGSFTFRPDRIRIKLIHREVMESTISGYRVLKSGELTKTYHSIASYACGFGRDFPDWIREAYALARQSLEVQEDEA